MVRQHDDPESYCLYHKEVEAKLGEHQRRLEAMDETTTKIYAKLDDIQNRLLGRPGWAVTVIITILTTLLGIAITIALHLHKVTP